MSGSELHIATHRAGYPLRHGVMNLFDERRTYTRGHGDDCIRVEVVGADDNWTLEVVYAPQKFNRFACKSEGEAMHAFLFAVMRWEQLSPVDFVTEVRDRCENWNQPL